jgi:hypothetical protein
MTDNKEKKVTFFTAVNCIDGRAQIPIINYLKERFQADYIDLITEPGVNLILAEASKTDIVESILRKIKLSLERNKSTGIAVAGHYDCKGNPAGYDEQIIHIKRAIHLLKEHYQDLPVLGLWVDKDWVVHEVSCN